MKRCFQQLLRQCAGVTSIEYSLIAVLISLFVIAGATLMGQNINSSFNAVQNGFTTAAPANR